MPYGLEPGTEWRLPVRPTSRPFSRYGDEYAISAGNVASSIGISTARPRPLRSRSRSASRIAPKRCAEPSMSQSVAPALTGGWSGNPVIDMWPEIACTVKSIAPNCS